MVCPGGGDHRTLHPIVDWFTLVSVPVGQWCAVQLGRYVVRCGGVSREDGLASVGVGAVGGVEAAGPADHCFQFLSSLLQGGDAGVEIVEVVVEEVENVVAGGGALFAEFEDRADLLESEAGGLCVANEANPVGCVGVVAPVAVGGALGRGEDPDLLVVADGLGVDPGSAS